MTTSFPLHWPAGWPRTEPSDRDQGRFGRRSDYSTKNITVSQAVQRVLDECKKFSRAKQATRIDSDSIIISTNIKVRLDGLPRSGEPKPDDPGVAIYSMLGTTPQSIPCDKYNDVAQNLAAVAATLAALRTLERHGSGIMERAFTGFEALPNLDDAPWYVVLRVSENASHDEVTRCYKTQRSLHHPDKGGSDEEFRKVLAAWDEYKQLNAEVWQTLRK